MSKTTKNNLSSVLPSFLSILIFICILQLQCLNAFSQTWDHYENIYPDTGYFNKGLMKIIVDSADNKWILSNRGLVKIKPNGQKEIHDESNTPAALFLANTFILDRNNPLIWIGGDNGLLKFTGTNWTVYDAGNSNYPGGQILNLGQDKPGNIWMSISGKGMFKFENEQFTKLDLTGSGIETHSFSRFTFDNNDDLWVATWDGNMVHALSVYNGSTWQNFFSVGKGKPMPALLQIIFDRNNNAWIGTFDDHVYQYDGTAFIHHTPNSDYYDAANPHMDSKGNIWFLSLWGNVMVYNGIEWMDNFANSLSGTNNANLTSIAFTQDGDLWLTSANGLFHLKMDSSYFNFPKPPLPPLVYPNPADNSVFIRCSDCKKEQVSVYDMLGRKVLLQADLETTLDSQSILTLNTENMPAGAYFIKYSSSLKEKIEKLLVIH